MIWLICSSFVTYWNKSYSTTIGGMYVGGRNTTSLFLFGCLTKFSSSSVSNVLFLLPFRYSCSIHWYFLLSIIHQLNQFVNFQALTFRTRHKLIRYVCDVLPLVEILHTCAVKKKAQKCSNLLKHKAVTSIKFCYAPKAGYLILGEGKY